MEIHRTLGDKVRLYRRREGGTWHCSTYLKGKEWRQTTKEKSLARAKDIAEDWYLELCAKDRFGELRAGKTFAQAAQKFEEEYEAITRGHRSPKWVQGHKDRIRLHLLPSLRQYDRLRDHLRGRAGIPRAPDDRTQAQRRGRRRQRRRRRGSGEAVEAARPQHHPQRNRHAQHGAEDGPAPWLARPRPQSLGPLPAAKQGRAPAVVHAQRIQAAL